MTGAGASGEEIAFWSLDDGGTGHLYEFVPTSLGYNAALAAAAARSQLGTPGHLATIHSLDENELLRRLAFYGSTGNSWIGLAQPPGSPEPAADFGWVTGEPVSYANWSPGEPNDSGLGEDAAALYDNGRWNDLPLGFGTTGYFVEYPIATPLRTSNVVLQMTENSDITVSFLINGTPLDTTIASQLFGQFDTRFAYTDPLVPFGIALNSSIGTVPDMGGTIELPGLGGADYVLSDIAMELVHDGATNNQLLPIDSLGMFDTGNLLFQFTDGQLDYVPFGALGVLLPPGTIDAVDDLRPFRLGEFGPAPPGHIDVFPTGDPRVYEVRMTASAGFVDVITPDLPALQIQFDVDLEAVGYVTIVPEPSTWALAAASSLGGLVFWIRRRRRRPTELRSRAG